MKEDHLDEATRAEDIILGSLGYGGDARVVSIVCTSSGYHGVARWADGEEFEFASEDELDDLQRWALAVLGKER